VDTGEGWCLLVGLDPVRVIEGWVFDDYSVFLKALISRFIEVVVGWVSMVFIVSTCRPR